MQTAIREIVLMVALWWTPQDGVSQVRREVPYDICRDAQVKMREANIDGAMWVKVECITKERGA